MVQVAQTSCKSSRNHRPSAQQKPLPWSWISELYCDKTLPVEPTIFFITLLQNVIIYTDIYCMFFSYIPCRVSEFLKLCDPSSVMSPNPSREVKNKPAVDSSVSRKNTLRTSSNRVWRNLMCVIACFETKHINIHTDTDTHYTLPYMFHHVSICRRQDLNLNNLLETREQLLLELL